MKNRAFSSLTLVTNVLYLFVHCKETLARPSSMSCERNLPNRKQKPAPTSSQPQTLVGLKHRRRLYCILSSVGLPLTTSVVWATPKCHKFKGQHRDQSVLSQ